MSLHERFSEYFSALERSGGEDRCFLCRRTPADVKQFFGFREDGTPLDPARYGIEDIVLERLDIMSYRAARPLCAICQLNFDAIFLTNEHPTLSELLRQMEHERERLWPPEE